MAAAASDTFRVVGTDDDQPQPDPQAPAVVCPAMLSQNREHEIILNFGPDTHKHGGMKIHALHPDCKARRSPLIDNRIAYFLGVFQRRSSLFLFTGVPGVVTSVLVPACVFAVSYKFKRHKAYNLEPKAKEGAFEPFLQKYLHLAEVLIGLASGSIVLLVGSSALHGQSGHLPAFYATPLIIISASVLLGLAFMAWLLLAAEYYAHGGSHTPLRYAVSESLGISCLLLFSVGYFWLIFAVTK